MPEIQLPFQYTPRWYQMPAWQALEAGCKRMLLIRHRRAGKDKDCINMMARATQERVGTYFYFLPTFAQGKRVIWDGMDGDGFRFLHHFPRELWDGDPNQTDMRIRMKNGSVFQVVGSDKIDNVVGTNPIGCVFSEYSLQDPKGWEFIRPILRENGGWAIFNGTPRGKANHLHKLYQMAQGNDDWYVERLGIEETGVLTEEDVEDERKAGMDEELIQQEFYCSFEGGMQGAYYVQQMLDVVERGGITQVPYDPLLKVHTSWDLGIGDNTSICFFQISPAGQIRIIDHHSASGEGLEYYVYFCNEKSREGSWTYGDHLAPWDINVREMGTGKSRLEAARAMGINFKPVRKLPLDEGINAVRMMLPLVWFNESTTEHLRDSLMSYSKKWDNTNKCWSDKPRHDWASHDADCIRYMAIGRRSAEVPEREDRYARHRYRRHSTSWMVA